jgi:hypothetical protein
MKTQAIKTATATSSALSSCAPYSTPPMSLAAATSGETDRARYAAVAAINPPIEPRIAPSPSRKQPCGALDDVGFGV